LTVFVIAHSDSRKLLGYDQPDLQRTCGNPIEDLGIVVFDGASTDDTLAVAKARLQ